MLCQRVVYVRYFRFYMFIGRNRMFSRLVHTRTTMTGTLGYLVMWMFLRYFSPRDEVQGGVGRVDFDMGAVVGDRTRVIAITTDGYPEGMPGFSRIVPRASLRRPSNSPRHSTQE